jgi:hypothetical protein
MLGRLGTLALAIVVAVLPSLSRICLTGCDADAVALARSERSHVEQTIETDGGGDSECPLHAAQPSPDTAPPTAPVNPAPCQHQQALASADAARSLNLALGSDDAYTAAPALTAAAATVAISATSVATRRPHHPRPVTNALILRI